jgi:hypothetical protein
MASASARVEAYESRIMAVVDFCPSLAPPGLCSAHVFMLFLFHTCSLVSHTKHIHGASIYDPAWHVWGGGKTQNGHAHPSGAARQTCEKGYHSSR